MLINVITAEEKRSSKLSVSVHTNYSVPVNKCCCLCRPRNVSSVVSQTGVKGVNPDVSDNG